MAGVNRDRLRELIKERGVTPRAVSRAVGGAEPNDYLVRDILSGKSKNPRADTLAKIAQYLDVPMSELMVGDAGPPSEYIQASDPRIAPKYLQVRYRVRAGLWREVEFDEPPEAFSIPVLPNPRYAEWPQWVERVEGDSANLKVQDGQYVHVVDAQEMGYAPRDGDWVVVERRRDQGAIRERSLKQVEIVPGIPQPLVRLWPRSTNPKWSEPVDMANGTREDEEGVEVVIVGKVIGLYDPNF